MIPLTSERRTESRMMWEILGAQATTKKINLTNMQRMSRCVILTLINKIRTMSCQETNRANINNGLKIKLISISAPTLLGCHLYNAIKIWTFFKNNKIKLLITLHNYNKIIISLFKISKTENNRINQANSDLTQLKLNSREIG